jgi:gliding motility-associated-like protein
MDKNLTLFSKNAIILLFLFLYLPSFAQSFYYVTDNNTIGIIDPATCTDKVVVKAKLLGYTFSDIAFHPSGTLYGIENSGRIYTINLTNGNTTFIKALPNIGSTYNYTSLTADKDGIIYAAASNLVLFNPATGIVTSKGSFPAGMEAAGDLTFRKGNLYMMNTLNEVVEIDINNPSASKVLFKVPTPNSSFSFYGIVTFVQDCDNTTTYATGIDFNTNQSFAYTLNLDNKTASLNCDKIPFGINGAATDKEFLASKCDVIVDLDANNSSGAAGYDFKTSGSCITQLPIADIDARLTSQKTVDTLEIRFKSGILDVGEEYLVFPSSTAKITVNPFVSGQSAYFINKGTANISDFEALLKMVVYKNTHIPATPGSRTINVILYAAKKTSDVATATLTINQAATNAGNDAQKAFCNQDNAFDLFTLLGNQADKGGTWKPNLTNGQFDPKKDAVGNYLYIVGSAGCKLDTAKVIVSILPNPIVQLGRDTTTCEGNTVTIKNQSNNANTLLQWSTGAINTPQIEVTKTGVYSLESTDMKGCKGKDEITITFVAPQVVKENISINEGESYTLGGSTYTQAGTYSHTFKNQYGCDSLYTATLSIRLLLKAYPPNVFSPNGDTHNDFFTIFTNNQAEKINLLRIFDRWGNLVYERTDFPPNDDTKGWDGTYRGISYNSGEVFTFFAEILHKSGEKSLIKGDVTILK